LAPRVVSTTGKAVEAFGVARKLAQT